MTVILLDRRGLARRLQPLGQHQRGAFAASCAQRLGPGFLDSPAVRIERSDDLQVAQGLLTELWAAAASGTAARLGPLVRAVEQMPELTAYEEWEGRGAYQTDALAALLYAGRSWQPSPTTTSWGAPSAPLTRRRSWTGSLPACRKRTRWRISAR